VPCAPAFALGAACAWLAACPPVCAEGAERLRDPFWPVGHVASARARAGGGESDDASRSLLDISRLSPEEQEIIRAHMNVGGIMERGRERVAIINSEVVREGDTMAIDVRGQTYRFLIRSLQPHNIALEPVVADENKEPEAKETQP